ncbi:MAG: response regulator [Deltaproteobacteria bacterium]|nr:response regulator [Deltaproteobacteria bacterium]
MNKAAVSRPSKFRDADKTIRVLFEISNAVNNTFNIDELYKAIHQILGKILNVDNFFIAIHNKEKNSILFPYFVDEMDKDLLEVLEISKKNSLTARVINEKRPLLVRKEELESIMAQTTGATIGSPSKVWAGVPLKVKNEVLGAIVLQSYTSEDMYKESDLELLNSVSEFLALAIERKQAEDNIRQNEKVTKTLYSIANAVNITDNLNDLYESIYDSLNRLMALPNFFIAILNGDNNSLHFSFYLDEYDSEETISSFTINNIYETNLITKDVLKSKKPLFLSREMVKKRRAEGKISGTLPLIWLGVPLIVRDDVIGVMVVQHYHDPEYFTQKDMDLLVAISDQVALAIDRTRAQEMILAREKQIRNLSRQTQEFSLVAASIISQKDENQLFKDISRAIVKYSDYNRLIMSYFMEEPPYRQIIGFEGIDENKIKAIKSKDAPKLYYENIFNAGIKLGKLSCYLSRKESEIIGNELPVFKNREKPCPHHTWHPDDMLFIRMNDADGNLMGVISVDDSKSGKRPTDETVGPLEVFASLISQIIIFRKIQNELKEHKENLEHMVAGRTRELTTEISERVQIEKKLKKAKLDAEAASRAKGEFLANMSHEIRTPINGIMGMAELALEQVQNKELKKIIQTIDSEANALLTIINEVLDFSKIEAGKFEIENISFDIRHTFEQACSSLAMGINDKDIEFISFLSPDIPNCLKGDPGRFRQILVNLASNALKFTNKGEILIQGEVLKDFKTSVELKFIVKDTGIGIPLEKQADIFKSFSQADGSTTRKYGGTGLGTTISKQLVELMGGKIGLESKEGKGSVFWFTIMFEKSGEPDKAAIIHTGLKDKTILVIEDNKTSANVLTSYLNSFGCRVFVSGTGAKAVSFLEKNFLENKILDVILVSFQLPDMDGFRLARIVRGKEKLKTIPIVMLTSSGRPGDGRLCKEVGINGYLLKPLKQEELKLAIGTVIGNFKYLLNDEKRLVTRHSIAEQMAKNTKVLLVEDYPTNQQIAMKYLTKAGYNATLAENGKIAVRYFKQKQFDLILMDIQMPEMDGYEATFHIRNHEKKINKLCAAPVRIPIIALTAHALEGYREQCLEADMDDYMTKPLKRDLFLSIIHKWISKTHTGNIYKKQIDQDKAQIKKHNNKRTKDYPMDYRRALDEFEDDDEFLKEVIEEFLGNVEDQLPAIEKAMKENDYETVSKESHAIKGGAANLTAMALSKKAHDLELIGKKKEPCGGMNAVEELKKEFKALKAFLKEE